MPLDVESLPAELTERWEIDGEALQNAIDHLPDAYKLVVLSFYFEDRSYREIAEQARFARGDRDESFVVREGPVAQPIVRTRVSNRQPQSRCSKYYRSQYYRSPK